MERFKKRLRLLAEQLNGSVEYGHDGSLQVHVSSRSATFTSKSYETMGCSIDLGDGPRAFPLPKGCMFDIVDRLAKPHLASTLRDYHIPPILDLHDYIDDEHGLPRLQSLQQELAENPSLVRKNLGGNRILAEYFRGVLILRDDLIMAGTNVIEFGPSSPALGKAT